MNPSMNYSGLPPISGPDRAVAFCAQLPEDVHYCGFTRIYEGPARDVLGVVQQFFRLGHVVRIGLSVRKIFARVHAVTHVVTR